MSSLILWISAELWLSRKLTTSLTREVGHFYPQLHSHPLQYNDKVFGHSCDACGARRITEAYRCSACDYDMCLNCVR